MAADFPQLARHQRARGERFTRRISCVARTGKLRRLPATKPVPRFA
jgi:hypothetical protein